MPHKTTVDDLAQARQMVDKKEVANAVNKYLGEIGYQLTPAQRNELEIRIDDGLSNGKQVHGKLNKMVFGRRRADAIMNAELP